MPSRRTFLRAAAVGLTAVSGCLGTTDEPTANTGSAPTTDTPTPTDSETAPRTTSTDTPTPGPGTVAWRASLSGTVTRPVRAGDRLVVGTEEGVVAALSRTDGSVRWSIDTGEPVQGRPVVENGVAYVVSGQYGLGDHQTVRSVDIHTGDVRWEFAPEDWWLDVIGVRDGTVFVASSDDNVQSSGQTLYARAVSDGSNEWTAEIGDNAGGLLTDDTVYVPSRTRLDAIATDGTRRWSYEVGEYQYKTLAVAGETVALVSSPDPSDPTVHGIDATTGDRRWTFDEDWRAYTTMAHGDRLFVGDQKLVAIDPATGESEWVTDKQAALYDVPVADGTAYVGNETLGAVSLDDGSVAWRTEIGADLSRPVALADRTVVVLGSAGDERNRRLLGFDTNTGDSGWTFEGEHELTEPITADGRAYLGSGSDVLALAV